MLCLTMSAYADMPVPRVDGTWGKGPVYKTKYEYDQVVYGEHDFNFKEIVIEKGELNYLFLKKIVNKALYGYKSQHLQGKYAITVEEEFDLTPKEKAFIEEYKDWPGFKENLKTNKRKDRHSIVKVGPKEYDGDRYKALDAFDMTGDGKIELIVSTYSIYNPWTDQYLMIFNDKGEIIWERRFQIDEWRVLDYDLDGDNDILIYSHSLPYELRKRDPSGKMDYSGKPRITILRNDPPKVYL